MKKIGCIYSMAVPILSRSDTFKSKLEDKRYKFGVDPCTHSGDPLDQKVLTDRQTTKQMAFQLYVVED